MAINLPAERRQFCGSHVVVIGTRAELAPGRGFRDPIAAAYTRAGIERQVAMTVPSFSAAAAVVTATQLVATLPRSLFGGQGARWGLRAVNGPVPEQTIAIALCWHERTHADAAAAAFRALVAAVIRHWCRARATRSPLRLHSDHR